MYKMLTLISKQVYLKSFKFQFASTLVLINFPDILQMAQTLPQSKTSLLHEFEGDGFYLAQFKTPQLAIFSYYLQSEGQACLIDPTYQVYPYQQIAEKRKAKLISILLTHYHADYVAGHTEMDLPIIMGPNSQKQGSKVKLYEMKDNSTFNLGSVWIKVLHTPGHTLESTCFQLVDNKHKQSCLFTGDTIFLGEVGRPDLAVSSSLTKEGLAKLLFESIRRIVKNIDSSVRIYPTHGSGSACGNNIGEGNFCTLENQLKKNYALQIQNEQEFVSKILSEMPKPPSYFFHDAKINQTGKVDRYEEQVKHSSKALSVDQFKSELEKGSTLIDSRHELGGKSIKGSFLMSENGTLATWVGLLINPQTPLVLFCNKQKAKDLIERLLRIGYFNIQGYNGFTIDEWQQKGLPIWEPKSISAQGMSKIQERTNLDVRNLPEWKSTGVIEGSKVISLGELSSRVQEVKGLKNIYISCKSGLRARLASSILAKNQISSVIVADKFEQFEKTGLKIVPYQ